MPIFNMNSILIFVSKILDASYTGNAYDIAWGRPGLGRLGVLLDNSGSFAHHLDLSEHPQPKNLFLWLERFHSNHGVGSYPMGTFIVYI